MYVFRPQSARGVRKRSASPRRVPNNQLGSGAAPSEAAPLRPTRPQSARGPVRGSADPDPPERPNSAMYTRFGIFGHHQHRPQRPLSASPPSRQGLGSRPQSAKPPRTPQPPKNEYSSAPVTAQTLQEVVAQPEPLELPTELQEKPPATNGAPSSSEVVADDGPLSFSTEAAVDEERPAGVMNDESATWCTLPDPTQATEPSTPNLLSPPANAERRATQPPPPNPPAESTSSSISLPRPVVTVTSSSVSQSTHIAPSPHPTSEQELEIQSDDDEEVSIQSQSSQVSHMSGAGGSMSQHNIKQLMEAADVAVTLAKLRRLLPGIDDVALHLESRGVRIIDVQRKMDRVCRAIYRWRGRFMQRRLKDELDSMGKEQAAHVDWEDFIRGSRAVEDVITLKGKLFSSSALLEGYTITQIGFTSSDVVLMESDGTVRCASALTDVRVNDVRGQSITSQCGADNSEAEKSLFTVGETSLLNGNVGVALVLKLRSALGSRLDGEPSVVMIDGEDSLAVMSNLTSRISKRFSRGVNAIRGVMRRSLKIIHFNDVYHLEPHRADKDDLTGGAARFLTRVREIQEKCNPLILFSGDFMSPSLMSVMMRGRHMIDAFNLIGVHVASFGNHEFDYGLGALDEALNGSNEGNLVYAGSNTRWVMSNMIETETGQPLGGAESELLLTWNGIRIGILGLAEDWLPNCAQIPKGHATYLDLCETGEERAQSLRMRGAELVIALTHNRFKNDKILADSCPSIDLILGGHDHFFKNSPQHRVVKSGEEFRWLSEIEVDVGALSREERRRSTVVNSSRVKYNVNVHPIVNGIEPHLAMDALINRYRGRLQSKMGKVIAVSNVPLDCTEACCRFREGLLPGFITDVMAQRAKADFAVLGGAAIAGKSVMPPGDITVGDVFNWFPNDTRVMTVKLRGETVIRMLNVMVLEVPNEAPSFPHPSGNLSFTINTLKTPTTVTSVKVFGKPIEEDTEYVVAVEDFVGLGKAKYKFVPKDGKILTEEEMAEQLTFWIIDYFALQGSRSANERKRLNLIKLKTVARAQTQFAKAGPKADEIMQKRLSLFNMAGSTGPAEEELPDFGSSATMAIDGSNVDFGVGDPSDMAALLSGPMAAALLVEQAKLGFVSPHDVNTLNARCRRSLEVLLGVEEARVFVREPNTNIFWTRVKGARKYGTGDHGLHATCFKKGEAITINNVDLTHDGIDEVMEMPVSGELRDVMFVPVRRYKQDVLAVLQLSNKLPDPTGVGSPQFGPHDAIVASAYANTFAPYLDAAMLMNTNIVNELRHRQMIDAVCQLVNPNVGLSNKKATLKDKIEMVVKHAKQIFQCKKAFLFVYDEAMGEVWTTSSQKHKRGAHRAAVPLVEEMSSIVRRRVNEAGVVGQVISTKQSVRSETQPGIHVQISSQSSNNENRVSPSVKKKETEKPVEPGLLSPQHASLATVKGKASSSHESASFLQSSFRGGAASTTNRSVLGVPLYDPDAPRGKIVIGVLLLTNKDNDRDFTAVDEALCVNYASFAAIAVSNSMELEALQTGVRRTELPVFPVHELNRIQITRGWGCVRALLPIIVSEEFREKSAAMAGLADSLQEGGEVDGNPVLDGEDTAEDSLGFLSEVITTSS